MKAHIVKAEAPVYQARDDVLARVVLHPAQALFEVQAALDAFTHGERAVTEMDDLAAALLHVQHMGRAESAGVGALAAALREEGRAVEDDGKAALCRLAGQDPGGEDGKMAVGITELFGHGKPP